jgi:hypothetical protein
MNWNAVLNVMDVAQHNVVVKKVVLLEPFFYIEKKCPIDGIFAVMI